MEDEKKQKTLRELYAAAIEHVKNGIKSGSRYPLELALTCILAARDGDYAPEPGAVKPKAPAKAEGGKKKAKTGGKKKKAKRGGRGS